MPEFSKEVPRGITFHLYAAKVGKGEVWSRYDFAETFNVSYSTALYHVERAVSAGILNKAYGFINHQPGWLYALPATMQRLGGV
jgi:hypothetical protein